MSDDFQFIVGDQRLDSVIATDELDTRPTPRVDGRVEAEVFLELNRALSRSPETFFSQLAQAAMRLSAAESAGISLVSECGSRFVWPAIEGKLSPHIGQGTPREFGPCGTVLDQDRTLLMKHPERHFAYLAPITPALEEVLLVPFYFDGNAVGTIWAVIHSPSERFSREDRRVLEELSNFAAAAYKALVEFGRLDPLRRPMPA